MKIMEKAVQKQTNSDQIANFRTISGRILQKVVLEKKDENIFKIGCFAGCSAAGCPNC